VIEVLPTVGVKIRAGSRLLLELPVALAARQARNYGKWSRAD
jgi:hypothetical protein